MTEKEINKIANAIAEKISCINEVVLTMDDIKKMFGVNSTEAIYAKINAGLPARRKKGIGTYFLKSEVIAFLKKPY